MKKYIVTAIALITACSINSSSACTSMIITKGASADGSLYITHSNDGYTGDTSVVYVPAADHKKGEMRQDIGFADLLPKN